MLTVKEIETNVWELTLKGVVEKGDIAEMERALTPALEGDGPLGLIVRAEDWTDITADAMAADARFEFGLMTKWAKIARMAVVSDLQAFAAILRGADVILPMIEMRSFRASQVAEAEAFVRDLRSDKAKGAGRGIRLLSDGADGVIAYEIDGTITQGDIDAVMEPLTARMTGETRINLLVRFVDWEGFDPEILTKGGLWGTKMNAIGHLRRYAVVGAPKWMTAMAGMAATMLPFEMRTFDADEDAAAWDWVRAA
ncbi:STAS/SEC14 domain-containing protein [uncultured Jannaschia sp.]|uniref:STAS/SEC14 domain-containing protein n=1 Tax=uncultured Jannaschia sp. TaxID=293347 RepID=UPI002622B8D5|nr:STAS/SEC14 domain-containing protein [uncultured Jannaschia sp.]